MFSVKPRVDSQLAKTSLASRSRVRKKTFCTAQGISNYMPQEDRLAFDVGMNSC